MSSILPSSPADQKKLAGSIGRIVDALTRIHGERAFINDEKKAIKENFDVEADLIGNLIKARDKMNADEIRGNAEDFDLFHEALFEINQDAA